MNKLFATLILALPLVACEKANTTPPVTKPAVTTPAETKPVETKPAETKPAETKPAETPAAQPATKPAETKPAEQPKPAETKPADTKPAETKPADKPVETKPVETKPATPVTPAGTTPATTPPAEKKAETPVAAKVYYVQFETTKGNIVLELNNEKAPISTANFLKYVDKGHYAGTVFHRVINGFMIQGGGFTKDGTPKATEAPIKNEWQNGLKNMRGTIAMARTNIADSATSQFFINVVDNAALDMARDGAAYAVFGKVVAGMDVVDAIKAVQTGVKNGMRDWPVEQIEITKASRLTEEDAKKLIK